MQPQGFGGHGGHGGHGGNFHQFDNWNCPNNWSNQYKINVPRIDFFNQCKKCHGSGSIRYNNVFYPCRKCYKHKGYCVTCYGTGRSYLTGRNCPNCSGHGKYIKRVPGHHHPQGWGEWSDSD